jgi:hypothetical protein
MFVRAMAGIATAVGTMNILNRLSSSAYLHAMLRAVPFGILVANMIVAILMLLLSGLVGGGTIRLLGNRNGYLFAGAIGLAIAVYTLRYWDWIDVRPPGPILRSYHSWSSQ